MTTLVIYDSLYGNTEKIAKAIGESLGNAEIIRVKDASLEKLAGKELVIFGTPTHGGRPSQLTQQFLNKIPAGSLNGIRAAAFDTGIPAEGQKFFLRLIVKFFGYASKKLATTLKNKGANVIGAETFFVLGKEGPLKNGELERAQAWAKQLLQNK